MKKYCLVIFIVLSLFVLTACGKKGLVGSWIYKTGSYVYVFNDDGTGSYEYGSNVRNFTYTTDGNKITILYSGNTIPFETTYEIKDDELIIKDSYDNDTIYVRK